MPKKTLLFDLIKSLSRSEKRYFRLSCSHSRTTANYLQLFDVIDKQESYNEPAIKAHFAGRNFIKQLHVTKHYLRTLILKSLRNFHAQISKDAALKDILRNIEILFHKELYEVCESEIRRAEALVHEFELFAGAIELQAWRRKLAQAQTPHNYDSFLTTMDAQHQAILKLENLNRYWQLAIRISKQTILRNSNPIQDEHLLSDPQNAQSLEAKILHYNAAYFQCLGKQTVEEAERLLFELIEYLEGHPVRIAEDPGMYASSVNNFVSFLVFQKKYDQALSVVQRAKSTYEKWKIVSEQKTLFKQIMRTYNIELEIYRDTRDFEQKESFISSIEGFVKENRHKMPKSYLISFWFQLANIHFMQCNFEQALTWINELLNTRYRDIRIDLQFHARMLNLMIHLEQQNLFVLRYFVDSTRRFLRKQRTIAPHESILLKFFSTIAQTPLLAYKEKFQALKENLFPDSEETPASEAQDYIDYRGWVEEHLAK